MSGPNSTLSVGDTSNPDRLRVIFEFESVDRMQQFIDHVGKAVDEGDLPINFTWGAEAVHTYIGDTEPDDDESGEIVDPFDDMGES